MTMEPWQATILAVFLSLTTGIVVALLGMVDSDWGRK